MAEFILPSFLENQSVDDIHERMMENLPDDIDTSEGSHPWNLTYPAGYEKAYFAEYIMAESIKLIFPQFAEDYAQIMEYHAEMRGLQRKPAEYATGEITVKGPAGTEIPAESMFSTIGINDEPSIDFVTTEDAVIGSDGTVNIPIQAVLEGTTGNVPAATIVLNSSEIDDINEVINEQPTSGGVEIETIESLQQRIVEFDATQDVSYGGSPSDYKRWALEVTGTGSAVVVSPTDDTGKITIILTDASGKPASTELCESVYNHIMSPSSPMDRLAPINDQLQVIPPSTINLTITATVELTTGNTVEQAKAMFIQAMQSYIIEAAQAGEIKYTRVGSIISGISGINDYKDLKVNNGTENISVTSSQVPFIDASMVTFTEGTV